MWPQVELRGLKVWYLCPDRSFNLERSVKEQHQFFELLVAIIEAMTEDQMADDVGDGVVDDEVGVQRLASKRKKAHFLLVSHERQTWTTCCNVETSPLKRFSSSAQWANSFRMTGSRDFFPNPKYLRVESAKRLCSVKLAPLLKITPDQKQKNDKNKL